MASPILKNKGTQTTYPVSLQASLADRLDHIFNLAVEVGETPGRSAKKSPSRSTSLNIII